MGLIKGPLTIAKTGVKLVVNTAFYSLALYGAINLGIHAYNIVDYVRNLQPKEVTKTVEEKVRKQTIEMLIGKSLDTKSEENGSNVEQSGEDLVDKLRKDKDFTDNYNDWVD